MLGVGVEIPGHAIEDIPGTPLILEDLIEYIDTPIRIVFIIISDARRKDVVALRLHLVSVGSSDVIDKRITESIKRIILNNGTSLFIIVLEISPVEGLLIVCVDVRALARVKPARKDVIDT
jgi:hypothetical protein